MSICSNKDIKKNGDSGSKVPCTHPMDKNISKSNPQVAVKKPTQKEHRFRIKQLILSRLVVEFPLHDTVDLGMVVQRMWQDIETDTQAVKSRILTK